MATWLRERAVDLHGGRALTLGSALSTAKHFRVLLTDAIAISRYALKLLLNFRDLNIKKIFIIDAPWGTTIILY